MPHEIAFSGQSKSNSSKNKKKRTSPTFASKWNPRLTALPVLNDKFHLYNYLESPFNVQETDYLMVGLRISKRWIPTAKLHNFDKSEREMMFFFRAFQLIPLENFMKASHLFFFNSKNSLDLIDFQLRDEKKTQRFDIFLLFDFSGSFEEPVFWALCICKWQKNIPCAKVSKWENRFDRNFRLLSFYQYGISYKVATTLSCPRQRQYSKNATKIHCWACNLNYWVWNISLKVYNINVQQREQPQQWHCVMIVMYMLHIDVHTMDFVITNSLRNLVFSFGNCLSFSFSPSLSLSPSPSHSLFISLYLRSVSLPLSLWMSPVFRIIIGEAMCMRQARCGMMAVISNEMPQNGILYFE